MKSAKPPLFCPQVQRVQACSTNAVLRQHSELNPNSFLLNSSKAIP